MMKHNSDKFIKDFMNKITLKTKLSDANTILAIQGSKGIWDVDPYMQGMFNGMEMIMSIFEERKAKFKTLPKKGE